jgi:cell division cycle 14
MSISSVACFIQRLDQELEEHPSSKVVYCVDEGRRALTNAVFLLGAYMILKLHTKVEEVSLRFNWLQPSDVEGYRDATFSRPDFALSHEDCWRGLARGQSLGWVGVPTTPTGLWGKIDMAHYDHLDNPLNGDLNVVVPGEFVALRGPRDLGGGEYCDEEGCRLFSPGYRAELLGELGVGAVVRLCEAEYDAAGFTGRGLAHHDLPFPDCTAPPERVVEAFLAAADGAIGSGKAVAVHCRAGLGRTGTLIALYLMRRHGFGARAAMGWLRIMRPGSVIGVQQRYLCEAEGAGGSRGRSGVGSADHPQAARRLCLDPPEASSCGSADPAALAAQVAEGMDRRAAARMARPTLAAQDLSRAAPPPCL